MKSSKIFECNAVLPGIEQHCNVIILVDELELREHERKEINA